MKTILLISPYWREEHRWMVSSVKLADLWQRLGYKVVVLCMGHGSRHEKMSETLEIHRVPDLFLPDPWNYGIAFGFSGKALRLTQELKPDVIVVNKVLFWSSISALRLRFAGYKVLLLTDALVGITWWPRGRLAQFCSAIYAWTLGWIILKSASKIVFFHPQPPDVLKKLGIEGKSSVIPTGIDATPFTLTPRPSPEGRGEHSVSVKQESPFSLREKGLGMREVTVTYVGRMESVKGADDFAAAATIVKKDHPELAVQAVGWYKPGHTLVKEYGETVTFTGLRHDIPVVLAETDIFVLPSYSEGLSNALMEAMSAGCACIASDVGGNRFLIENGVSGFLFPAGDRAALASHIRRLVEDPAKRKSMGDLAQKRIATLFSWDKVGKQYDDLFRSWHS